MVLSKSRRLASNKLVAAQPTLRRPEPHEWEICHIEGATLIPGELENRMTEVNAEQETVSTANSVVDQESL